MSWLLAPVLLDILAGVAAGLLWARRGAAQATLVLGLGGLLVTLVSALADPRGSRYRVVPSELLVKVLSTFVMSLIGILVAAALTYFGLRLAHE